MNSSLVIERGRFPERSRSVGRNRFAIRLEELTPGGSPRDSGSGFQTGWRGAFSEGAIFMQHGDVLGQRFDVPYAMHEPMSPCGCKSRCRLRDASGTHPLPMASVITKPIPSSMLGSTRMSLLRISSGTSFR